MHSGAGRKRVGALTQKLQSSKARAASQTLRLHSMTVESKGVYASHASGGEGG